MFATDNQTITLYSFDYKGAFVCEFQYFWAVGTSYAANSTDIAPPTSFEDGNWPIFDGEKWVLKRNLIGLNSYSITDKSIRVIDYFGDVEEGYTLLAPNSEFDTWNDDKWEDGRTQEEIMLAKRSNYPSLTSRQFFLTLVENQLYDKVMKQIEAIEDATKKQYVKIEIDKAKDFIRLNSTVIYMQSLLNLTDDEIDELWEFGLAIPD